MTRTQIAKKMNEFEKALYRVTNVPMSEIEALTENNIKVRAMQIANKNHPEWGTFGVYECENIGGQLELSIGHARGEKVLDAAEFGGWVVVKNFFA
jgi:hypothetical protein